MKFIIFFCLINLVYLREDFKIRTKKVVCDCDKTICDNMQCILRPVKRNTQALTIGCYLHKPQNEIRVCYVIKEYQSHFYYNKNNIFSGIRYCLLSRERI